MGRFGKSKSSSTFADCPKFPGNTWGRLGTGEGGERGDLGVVSASLDRISITSTLVAGGGRMVGFWFIPVNWGESSSSKSVISTISGEGGWWCLAAMMDLEDVPWDEIDNPVKLKLIRI